MDAVRTDHDREKVLEELYYHLLDWRLERAERGWLYNSKDWKQPHPPEAVIWAPIKGGVDPVGVGWWTEGAVLDPETMRWRPGIVTPASEQVELVGRQAEALFEGGADEFRRMVKLPSGEDNYSGSWYRGAAAYHVLKRREPVREWVRACGEENIHRLPVLALRHGNIESRVRNWTAARAELANMSGKPPDARTRLRFGNAAYLTNEGILGARGGDGVNRPYIAVVHTKVFREPPAFPHDFDVRSWVTPQERYAREMAVELRRTQPAAGSRVHRRGFGPDDRKFHHLPGGPGARARRIS